MLQRAPAAPSRLPFSYANEAQLFDADLSVVAEGAFLLSKIARRPGLIADHLARFRRFLELLFRTPLPET